MVERYEWAIDASCRNCPSEDFALAFGKLHEQRLFIMHYCGKCPVREMCLEQQLSIEPHNRYGTHGGLTEDQLRKFRPSVQRGARSIGG